MKAAIVRTAGLLLVAVPRRRRRVVPEDIVAGSGAVPTCVSRSNRAHLCDSRGCSRRQHTAHRIITDDSDGMRDVYFCALRDTRRVRAIAAFGLCTPSRCAAGLARRSLAAAPHIHVQRKHAAHSPQRDTTKRKRGTATT